MRGFKVELIDVSAGSFNMSVDKLKKAINTDVAAVVPVHFLGFPARINEIEAVCKKYDVILVQDACETMNLKIAEKSIYNYGDIITHSFYHPHH